MTSMDAVPARPEAVPLAKSYLLLNHGPVTLVSSAAGAYRNVMAAAWAMPLDFDPPKVLLVVDSQTLTRELIEASGEFALNIPCRKIADQVLAAGSMSGRDGDKFARYGLGTFAASRIAAPLIRDCVAWLECRVIPEPANQKRYDLFIAEVVAAWADPAVFSGGRWHFPEAERRTIHYQAGGAFFATGEGFECGETVDSAG
ncbi:MAG: flavin reductase family protein [Propionivibrio sp.]